MKFTDSHCHLDFEEFTPIREQLLTQCSAESIHQIITPTIGPDNWQKVIHLANKLKNTHCKIFPSLGIHPWFLKGLTDKHLDDLASLVEQQGSKVIAIGETGIDGGIVKQQDNLEQQIKFFDFQLHLANQYQLPVIVHHRQSHQHIFPLLKQAKVKAGGIIHAFSGSYQQAVNYIDLGFKLGIGGTITYPRAKKTINAIKRLPLSSLVLETDAPAMPLYGKQGQNNSPLELINVFNALVLIRTEEKEEIAQQIERNISQVFKLA